MKKIILPLLFFFAFVSYAQQFPSVILKTLNGRNFNTSTIQTDEKPLIICFWKSCCKVNEGMLDAFSEVYEDWQKEFGVKIYAVSVDDSRTASKITALVAGKGWTLEFLQDMNSDFKRAVSVGSVPFILVYNSKGELIAQKASYQSGTEEEIYEILKKENSKP